MEAVEGCQTCGEMVGVSTLWLASYTSLTKLHYVLVRTTTQFVFQVQIGLQYSIFDNRNWFQKLKSAFKDCFAVKST